MGVTLASEPSVLRMDETGTIRIGATRVTLDTMVAAFHAGQTAEQFVQDYPSLDLGDVYAAIGYYLRHRDVLDPYLRDRHGAAEVFRAGHSELYPSGVRERLARRTESP